MKNFALPPVKKSFIPRAQQVKKIVKQTTRTIGRFIKEEIIFIAVIVVFVVLIGQLLMLQYLKDQTHVLDTKPDPFPQFEQAAYPLLQTKTVPTLSAQAAYILDLSSHAVIFSKNENLRFSPASTTKLTTALTALDYFRPDDILTAKDPHVVPVVLGLIPGEQMTFRNLLLAMLIPSANDAALTVAQNYPGGEDVFIKKMNEKIKLFHLVNTHFADPVGLNDDEDYTTVHDLAIIASYALSHPLLSQIMDMKSATVRDVNGKTYFVENTNELLGKYGVNGGKTGYTEGAGQVLVSSTTMNNGHTYIIVVMKSDDRFSDTQKLLQLIQDNIIYRTIHP